MAGRGPAPTGRAVRRNSGRQFREIEATPEDQPKLPTLYQQVEVDGRIVRKQLVWPKATRRWWEAWKQFPLASEFTVMDWAELMIAAQIHAEVIKGNLKLAPELRLRVSKFGVTPEDRARLQITFAVANATGNSQSMQTGGSRQRYSQALAVDVDKTPESEIIEAVVEDDG